jgi:hypothetical protein
MNDETSLKDVDYKKSIDEYNQKEKLYNIALTDFQNSIKKTSLIDVDWDFRFARTVTQCRNGCLYTSSNMKN